jgi:hypothetical protein
MESEFGALSVVPLLAKAGRAMEHAVSGFGATIIHEENHFAR